MLIAHYFHIIIKLKINHNNTSVASFPGCCHRKIGTPIFRYPRAMNPRIFGTLIPIFLGLRDPTRDLHPENWNPRKRTIIPGMLSTNASPYQECSQECFTVPKQFLW